MTLSVDLAFILWLQIISRRRWIALLWFHWYYWSHSRVLFCAIGEQSSHSSNFISKYRWTLESKERTSSASQDHQTCANLLEEEDKEKNHGSTANGLRRFQITLIEEEGTEQVTVIRKNDSKLTLGIVGTIKVILQIQ